MYAAEEAASMPKRARKHVVRKIVIRLPDLDHAKISGQDVHVKPGSNVRDVLVILTCLPMVKPTVSNLPCRAPRHIGWLRLTLGLLHRVGTAAYFLPRVKV